MKTKAARKKQALPKRLPVPVRRKDLQDLVEVLGSSLVQTTELFYLAAFYLVIKPVCDRYDWELSWGMGCVSFMNKHEVDVSECKTATAIEHKLEELIRDYIDISRLGAMIDVLTGAFPTSGAYHKSYGLGIDENRIRKFPYEKRKE